MNESDRLCSCGGLETSFKMKEAPARVPCDISGNGGRLVRPKSAEEREMSRSEEASSELRDKIH